MNQIKQEAKETIEKVEHNGMGAYEEAKEKAAEVASDLKNKAADAVDDTKKFVDEQVRNSPELSLFAAATLGFLLGLAVARR